VTALTRGERLNNPGNIEHGSNWQGLAAKQPDPRFCAFTDAKYGFRALAKVLLVYRAKGFDTIRTIIERWAPPKRFVDGVWVMDNNTDAYVKAVAGNMRCDPDTHLDVRDYTQMYPLVCAIVRHENGRNNYLRSTIDAGLALAGVLP
jgi:hypothetical protein